MDAIGEPDRVYRAIGITGMVLNDLRDARTAKSSRKEARPALALPIQTTAFMVSMVVSI